MDAHVAVELHVGVKDFTVEVFDTLDNARQRIRTLMLTEAELHNIVADKSELPKSLHAHVEEAVEVLIFVCDAEFADEEGTFEGCWSHKHGQSRCLLDGNWLLVVWLGNLAY